MNNKDLHRGALASTDENSKRKFRALLNFRFVKCGPEDVRNYFVYRRMHIYLVAIHFFSRVQPTIKWRRQRRIPDEQLAKDRHGRASHAPGNSKSGAESAC